MPALEALLRREGTASARQIGQALDISQPSVSRLLATAGETMIRIGKARATRYAMTREVGRAGRSWPLYRIDPHGQAGQLGQLHALHGGGYLFAPTTPCPALLHGEFADGLFPDLPWFLDDQRPQGFLGRAFARRVAAEIGAPADLAHWQSDDVMLALLQHGNDAPGDLVLGDHALQRALQRIVQPDGTVPLQQREELYPRYAEDALRGEDVGSSAGGEQPKFATTLEDGGRLTSVIVKFSERITASAGQRWADLLRCEHVAGQVLREHGLDAADSEIIQADGRVFLQSTRFDRTPAQGRRGFASLAALDAAFHGHGRIEWWRLAGPLLRDGWLADADARHLRLLGWFGALIGNSDMHLGNAGLMLTDTRPLRLAPAYDMLPMAFRPASTGEIVKREYTVTLPTPEFREDWLQASAIAVDFWQRIQDTAAISGGFRRIAADALRQLRHAVTRIGG